MRWIDKNFRMLVTCIGLVALALSVGILIGRVLYSTKTVKVYVPAKKKAKRVSWYMAPPKDVDPNNLMTVKDREGNKYQIEIRYLTMISNTDTGTTYNVGVKTNVPLHDGELVGIAIKHYLAKNFRVELTRKVDISISCDSFSDQDFLLYTVGKTSKDPYMWYIRQNQSNSWLDEDGWVHSDDGWFHKQIK